MIRGESLASICKIDGKWRALIRRKGHKPISKRFDTKGAAKAWADDIEAQLEAGKPLAGDPTIATLIEMFRHQRDLSRPILDYSTEHYTLKKLSAYLGHIKAQALSVDDLIGYAVRRKDENAGPYTVNCDISKLSTVIRYTGIGLPDVVGAARPKLAYLGLIGGGGRRERRPETDEMERILALFEQPYRDATIFAGITAMRRSEVIRIVMEDVDHQKKGVWIRDRKHPRKKLGNDEFIPLLNGAYELALAQKIESGRIFPIHEQTWSKKFTEACKTLSIPDLHLHDLRHEGVSRMFEQGFTLPEVALVSGHKDWKNLRRYTNLKPESLHAKNQNTLPRPDNVQPAFPPPAESGSEKS